METQNPTPVEPKAAEPMPAQPQPVTQSVTVHQKDNTLKTVLIVLGVISVLIVCCLGACWLMVSAGVFSLGNTVNQAIDQVKKSTDFSVSLVNSEYVNDDTLLLTLKVKNEGTASNTFSPFLYLELVDGNGKIYSEDYFYDVNSADKLSGEKISSGSTITGKIPFSVPRDVSKLDLKVKNNIFSEEVTTIKVK